MLIPRCVSVIVCILSAPGEWSGEVPGGPVPCQPRAVLRGRGLGGGPMASASDSVMKGFASQTEGSGLGRAADGF